MKPHLKESLKKIKDHFENMTPKEVEEMKEFFRDKKPKGWLSIEEHLPMMYAKDIMQGYSIFKVRFANGDVRYCAVCDGATWYYYAKEANIVKWWNPADDENEIDVSTILDSASYYKRKSELLLSILENTPCDTDSNVHQMNAWDDYNKFINETNFVCNI